MSGARGYFGRPCSTLLLISPRDTEHVCSVHMLPTTGVYYYAQWHLAKRTVKTSLILRRWQTALMVNSERAEQKAQTGFWPALMLLSSFAVASHYREWNLPLKIRPCGPVARGGVYVSTWLNSFVHWRREDINTFLRMRRQGMFAWGRQPCGF